MENQNPLTTTTTNDRMTMNPSTHLERQNQPSFVVQPQPVYLWQQQLQQAMLHDPNASDASSSTTNSDNNYSSNNNSIPKNHPVPFWLQSE
jgi:hypothetical protein